jgi:hypothetical protein
MKQKPDSGRQRMDLVKARVAGRERNELPKAVVEDVEPQRREAR